MERLTNHFNYCEFTDCPCYDEKLAKENKCKMCDVSIENCYRKSVYDKLRDYEDLEEKGLLLKLPYKIGDIVYSYEERSEGEYEIVEYEIYSISIDGKNMFTFYAEATDGYEEIEFSSNDIGVSVFNTIKDVYKN